MKLNNFGLQRCLRGMCVAAMCLGLMVTSARGGSLDSPSAPTADPGSNWSFAMFCDTRGDVIFTPSEPLLNTPVILAICAAITNDGALFALVPGDIVLGQNDGGTNALDQQLALWTNAVSALGRAGIPYYAVRGNHEINSFDETNRPAHADWTKHIGRYMPTNGPAGEIGMTYSLPFLNAIFIGLDNNNGTNDTQNYHKINQTWLDAQLSANTQPHVFVFGHEPAFQAQLSSTCLSENLPERNQFWDSIGNANSRAYLTGHSHLYGRCIASISNGPALRQIIVGAGGAPLEPWWDGEYTDPIGSGAMIGPEMNYTPPNTFGYLLVRVSGNHVVMEYKTTTNLTTWTTNDVFQYTVAATPANVNASDGTYLDRILVSWAAVADASGYEVWRGTNASGAGRALIVGITTPSFSDAAAVPGVLYYYWVRAINADGAGLYSAPDSGFLGVVGPLITANGLVGDVYLNSSDPVSIAVQMMNMEPYLGINVDWWVVVCDGSSWYYLNSEMAWIQEGNSLNWHPVYQGGLGNVPATEVLNTTDLSTGSYTFYFAVDYPMDGIFNVNGPILVNAVNVTVQ